MSKGRPYSLGRLKQIVDPRSRRVCVVRCFRHGWDPKNERKYRRQVILVTGTETLVIQRPGTDKPENYRWTDRLKGPFTRDWTAEGHGRSGVDTLVRGSRQRTRRTLTTTGEGSYRGSQDGTCCFPVVSKRCSDSVEHPNDRNNCPTTVTRTVRSSIFIRL